MKLYNTLSRTVEELKPLDGKKIKLYTCGLTVYSQPHIGNWLGYIYWDILVRTLEAEGYDVQRTQNITDVGHLTSDDDNGEDKMEKGAKREGLTAWDVAEKYIEIASNEGFGLLDLKQPSFLVRATDMIEQQIAFVKRLDELGYLYEISGDGMYFDTSKLADYGKLARLDIAGLEAGARVSVEGKRNITDFAVWKFSPVDSRRDMEWDSPWGKGFPGWHLECSVIAQETLGDQLDIHTGGIDHIPVHHTNEITQIESVTGKQFSQIWLHNNHMKVDDQKMAKSIGNIYTLQDIIDHGYSIDAFKVFALGKHYRTEGNFTWDNLESASNRLNHWRNIASLRWQVNDSFATEHPGSLEQANELVDQLEEDILDLLMDDLKTSEALAKIDFAVSAIEKQPLERLQPQTLEKLFAMIDNRLGLHILKSTPDISPDLQLKIKNRENARAEKNWQLSDEIRDELLKSGVALNDTPTGTTWYWL